MWWVRATEFFASAVDGKHPMDARAFAIAAALPPGDLRDQRCLFGDAAGEALADRHADLDLDHVEPARMLGREVEFDPAQDAAGLGGGKALVQRRL